MADAKSEDKSEDLSLEAQPYNEYEQECLEALRAELGADVVEAAPPGMVTRFIRGYAREKEPIKETIERFKACVAWREEFGANKMATEPASPEFLAELAEFSKKWPTGVYGRGKQGRPVYVEQVGLIEPAEVFDKYPKEKIEQFHVYHLEQLNKFKARLSEQYGQKFYKNIVIVDLTGFGTKHMGSKLRTPMRAMLDLDSHFYPESLHKMIIVNAPWAFKMLWKIVRPWVHPLTQQRIKFGKEHLWDHVEKDQVPSFIEGGTGRAEPMTFEELENFDSHGSVVPVEKKAEEEAAPAPAAGDAPAAAQ